MHRYRFLAGLVLLAAPLWWGVDQAIRAQAPSATENRVEGTLTPDLRAIVRPAAPASAEAPAATARPADSTTTVNATAYLPSRPLARPEELVTLAPAATGDASAGTLVSRIASEPAPQDRTSTIRQRKRIDAQEQLAAARARAARLNELRRTGGLQAEAAPAPEVFDARMDTDYNSDIPNWANSPAGVQVFIRGGGGIGALARATVTGGVITAIDVTAPGGGYGSAPSVIIAGGGGTGATATATVTGGEVTAIDVVGGGTGYDTFPGIRKFVDSLPGLTAANANNLGQFIPVGVADQTTYPGSDYYEIALVQFEEQLHSDLPPTTLRGYVQLETATITGAHHSLGGGLFGVTAPHYLGPTIVAQKDRPVRIKFVNALPTGAGGDLFIPTDVTIEGSGEGPIEGNSFTQNRATLHLHGGKSPWISDGTPHTWITPAGEVTAYPKGASAQNVPDMPDPGPGAQTFYYTNQQSARMMFYHDHAWGITRLNVYVGEAAGYLIRDAVEADLIARGVIPADEIPLVIQDKSFVDAATVLHTDPTWRWGTGAPDGTGLPVPKTGDLWWPHVYMPAQNPYDLSGANPMGRWHYGPWFWPPTDVPFGPIPNPLYDPFTAPWQPPEIPGTPNPSWGAEAFMDTPVVNGTAYPYLEVQPQKYRLRILNAAHDRFWNLQLYVADDTVPAGCTGCATNSEVKMVDAWPGNPTFPPMWPKDGRDGGVPDPLTRGPQMIQIGTEGGFLPMPVALPNQPVNWNADVTMFNAGNVLNQKDGGGTLFLAPAERADVVVDFSDFAGKTLILYNDAPAPWPALDPHYDYFTGNPDWREIGGSDTTQVGFGPNTRTVMQIRVGGSGGAATPDHLDTDDLATLEAEFASTAPYNPADPTGRGVFARGQEPIEVGQAGYNAAYGLTGDRAIGTTWPYWGVARIGDNYIQYRRPDGTYVGDGFSMATGQYMEPKAIQDEMGETFDMYGRMSAKLGLELAFTKTGVQTFVLQNYVDPPTEIVRPDEVQVWKITHNGVDTHPVHFHLFDVQILNRVGWDGFIRLPDENEYGWKDTIRVSPLEDTIVALRPSQPKLPFGIPNSARALNPAVPLGSTNGFSNIDPVTSEPIVPPVTNVITNLGWEYVWHCHILSHEEMDMMRTIVFIVETTVPDAPAGLALNSGVLTWTDPTPVGPNPDAPLNLANPKNEIGFRVEQSTNGGTTWTTVGVALANKTSFDVAGGAAYRVIAFNASGDSAPSNTVGQVLAPGAFGKLTPPSGAKTSTFPAFTWGASAAADRYEFCADTSNNNACNTTWQNLGTALTTTGNNWAIGTWYWQVRAANIAGTTQADAGAWWNIKVRRPLTDVDADAKVDLIVFRQSNDTWYVAQSTGSSYSVQWGSVAQNDVPVPGDYDGDAMTDLAVWRPANGRWYALLSSGGSTSIQWGSGGQNDVPVPGDYDGDGVTDLAVFRPGSGNWYVLRSTGGQATTQWGAAGDVPIPADYDGDGRTDLAVWRPSTSTWWIRYSNGGTAGIEFGTTGDLPVPGDYDGDAVADLAVFRPGNGTWYVRPSTTPGTNSELVYGVATDIPMPGDYDGDGKTDAAVWRPSTGGWYIWNSASSSSSLVFWGLASAGDAPVGEKQ